MAGAAVSTEVVASTPAVSMAAAFTLARFTMDLADFVAADGTMAQGASTMVLATTTAATGTTAGEAGDTAGGQVRGWRDLLSIWMGLLSGLRLLRLRPTQYPAELVLLFRSRRLLPLRNPVQHGLADGSR